MVTAVHGHSQLQRSHQCIAGHLERNSISNGGDWEFSLALTHRTEYNSESCHFTSVYCGSVVFHWSTVLVLQPKRDKFTSHQRVGGAYGHPQPQQALVYYHRISDRERVDVRDSGQPELSLAG
ncbi:hypothetical protein EVAR_21980_1 [Eumeta japonica]|uniref:Uncharacterized protein n=1 Tax=Eumeta variegata TaxID=151549 RepID=A0A4C1VXQ7_EUMVA|nr:hypothetical protein EVAR_21980_1 [Eumeta japonica]